MEIIDSKIQGNLLQEFTAKYLEEHKELVEHIIEVTKKQLLLRNVSQQREQLIAFAKYMEEYKMYARHDEANVDDFLDNHSN